MAKEIERKFLIRENGKDYATQSLMEKYGSVDSLSRDVLENGKKIRQGYLPVSRGSELAKLVRMPVGFSVEEARLRDKAGDLYLTLKSDGGLTREEAECEIGKSIFEQYWEETEGRRVTKARKKMPYQGHELEVDVYTDRDLIVAEVEVSSEEEARALQPAGKDITSDSSYKNKNLAN